MMFTMILDKFSLHGAASLPHHVKEYDLLTRFGLHRKTEAGTSHWKRIHVRMYPHNAWGVPVYQFAIILSFKRIFFSEFSVIGYWWYWVVWAQHHKFRVSSFSLLIFFFGRILFMCRITSLNFKFRNYNRSISFTIKLYTRDCIYSVRFSCQNIWTILFLQENALKPETLMNS